MNKYGLLDAAGNELLPMAYGDFMCIDSNWVLAFVLEITDGDFSEYKDFEGNRYIVTRTDVMYKGKVIGSLTRDDYVKSDSVGAHGAYMYVKRTSNSAYWLDSSFNRTEVKSEDYVYTSEFTYAYKDGMLHEPTQQHAFTAGCTLRAEDVEEPVWYDDNKGILLDLQGNAIVSDLPYYDVYFAHDYLITRNNKGMYGIATIDGTEIVEPKYEEIAEHNDILFPSGYNAVLDENGCLSYIDKTGAVTASVSYQLSSYDYRGFTYNAPFAVVNNLGRHIVITAACGELKETYDDFSTPYGGHRILSVKKGDVWGAIDLYGNTVIPFEYAGALSISDDGTLVIARRSYSEYVVYKLAYDGALVEEVINSDDQTVAEQPAEAENAQPALTDGAWECTCGTATSGKFCPECGAAKPTPTPAPMVTPAPVDDGSWVCEGCGSTNTSKFCPECGGAKPEVPAEPECASCGYKPEGSVPKFCPECGTKF